MKYETLEEEKLDQKDITENLEKSSEVKKNVEIGQLNEILDSFQATTSSVCHTCDSDGKYESLDTISVTEHFCDYCDYKTKEDGNLITHKKDSREQMCSVCDFRCKSKM